MYLFIGFIDRAEQPEKAIRRFQEFGLPDPWVVRARSVEAALSAEVPIFTGLRSLAAGADEDRLILCALLPNVAAEEAQRLVTRIQLEMTADDPPMGRVYALPLLAGVPG